MGIRHVFFQWMAAVTSIGHIFPVAGHVAAVCHIVQIWDPILVEDLTSSLHVGWSSLQRGDIKHIGAAG